MNVTYVLNIFPKLSETFIVDEITGLIDAGNNINIISLKQSQDIRDINSHSDILRYNLLSRTVYLDQIPYYPFYSLQNEFLIKVLSDTDIIMAHFAAGGAHFARRLKELFHIPYILTTHAFGLFINTDKNSIEELVSNASACITVSEYNKRFIVELIGEKYSSKISVIYNGVNDSFYAGFKHEKTENDIVRVLSVGRLTEKKGFITAIKGFSIALKMNKRLRYFIIGNGILEKELIALVRKLGIGKYVKFLGSLPRDEVIKHLSQSDIFMLPSECASNGDREGMPVSILEALAMGIPCISTYHTGIPEAISNNENGFLVNEKDFLNLGEELLLLANDSTLRERMGFNAKKTVSEKFTLSNRNELIRGIINRSYEGLSEAERNKSGRKEKILEYIDKNRNEVWLSKQYYEIQKKLNNIENDKWYRFGQYPKKMKMKVVIKTILRKMKLYRK